MINGELSSVEVTLAAAAIFFPIPLLVAAIPIFREVELSSVNAVLSWLVIVLISMGSIWVMVATILMSWNGNGDFDRDLAKWRIIAFASLATLLLPWLLLFTWGGSSLIDTLRNRYDADKDMG